MRELERIYPVDEVADGSASIAKRNQRMVDDGADLCLAFIGSESHDAIDCIRRARIAGIPVIERHPSTGPYAGD